MSEEKKASRQATCPSEQRERRLFLQLMQVALGHADRLDDTPSTAEWERLMAMTSEQGVMGVAFCGVERLPKAQRPPLDVLMDWSAVVDYTERENQRINALGAQVCEAFRRDGQDVCVLKGAGLGVLSPQPLRRMPGDIDLWMKGGRTTVTAYMRQVYGRAAFGSPAGHHVSVILQNVSVEVHHTPARLYVPWHNRRLLRLFKTAEAEPWTTNALLPDGHTIPVPTLPFNLVFVLAHFFYHWTFEGCGMKQLLDYYWLTMAAEHLDAPTKAQTLQTIERLGMKPLLSAFMHIFRQFGMDEAQLLCPPDARLGLIVLDDMFQTGAVTADDFLTGRFAGESRPRKFFRRLHRLVRIYPVARGEVVFMMWNSVRRWFQRKWEKEE